VGYKLACASCREGNALLVPTEFHSHVMLCSILWPLIRRGHLDKHDGITKSINVPKLLPFECHVAIDRSFRDSQRSHVQSIDCMHFHSKLDARE